MAVREQQRACMASRESQRRNPSPSSSSSSRRRPPPPVAVATATTGQAFAPLSFFKVMIGNFSQALFLPPLIARKLGGLLNKNVDIEDSNGHRWGVKVSLVNNHLAFEQGWQEFVLDHSIKVGEFVVFNHDSKLFFSAKVYAITGCERLEFNEKSIANKSKTKRETEASADDLSLQKSKSVRKLDKDGGASTEGPIKKKQATKSGPCDTSDNRMVTRSMKADVKRKREDVDGLETSHGRSASSKRPQIEIVKPAVLRDQMVDKTDQISPAGPVKEAVDVVTMTNGDSYKNAGDFVSKDMSRDEQMSHVNFVEIPVEVASRDSVFMKGSITVSSISMIASETKGNSCVDVETETLVTKRKLSHESSNETEADCIKIVNSLTKSSVLTGDNSRGIHAVSSANSTASKANGNLCGAIENPPKIVAVSSVVTIPSEAIGNSNDALQTTDGLVMNNPGHGSQNDTEENCEIAMDPLISEKVITGDSLQINRTDEATNIKLEGSKTVSFESFDYEVTEEILNAFNGVVYKFLGTLEGVCHIVEEDFADKFVDGIVTPIDFSDADIVHKTYGAFNEDETWRASPTVPLNNISQNEEELGSLGDIKVHTSRKDVNAGEETASQAGKTPHASVKQSEKMVNPSSEINVLKDEQIKCLMRGKKPDELLEENEKKSSLNPEVTTREDLKTECKDLKEFPSSDSFIFKFHLPAGTNPWLELPECIPYNFRKIFLSRKVIVLQDPVMRMWPVLYSESKRFTGFLGGWKDFTAANNLKEGDMCELHLVDKETYTFCVRITKAENPYL